MSAPQPDVRATISRAPDRSGVVAAARELLRAAGADVGRAGLARTPERMADYYLALFAGSDGSLAESLGEPMRVDDARDTRTAVALEVIRVGPIPFRSVCEHHMLPFSGTVEIAYTPLNHIAGLSRLASLVRAAARRPQLQEDLTLAMADAVMTALAPRSVEVRVSARHDCVAVSEPESAACDILTVAAATTDAPVSILERSTRQRA